MDILVLGLYFTAPAAVLLICYALAKSAGTAEKFQKDNIEENNRKD